MKTFVGILMALVLVRGQGEKAQNGHCVDGYCFTLHRVTVDFYSAQKACEATGGRLMTVRTTAANDVISYLLTGYTGQFWIGLKYTHDFCSHSTHALKGYTWITGDNRTNFSNWKSNASICSQSCVSVSRNDPKWTERLCNDPIEGFLCEYVNANKCRPLQSMTPVLYETPFGFTKEDLHEVPDSSNATRLVLGTRHICSDGNWIQAPWSCEVYKGGCEYSCSNFNNTFRCTCPSGYKLESNEVRCTKVYADPCLQADCSQRCIVVEDKYVCQCDHGYELGKDGKTCKDINECDNERLCPGENSYCVNTAGGFECRCKIGFNKAKETCEDVDECASGPCDHTCVNTLGSYHCQCSDGYKVSSGDRHKCTVHCTHWECPAVDCDYNNAFQCNCPEGFIFEERSTGNFCTDIDECEVSDCNENCTNTPGGYVCSCNEGFDFTDNTKCAEGSTSSTTTPMNTFTTTSRYAPVETASFLSDGFLLGITVCSVTLIVLMACVSHHNVKRCRKIYSFPSHKAYNEEIYALQQISIEKYTTNLSIRNVNFK